MRTHATSFAPTARRIQTGAPSSADLGIAIGGGVTRALRVPQPFAADGLLSRSLRWFNSGIAH